MAKFLKCCAILVPLVACTAPRLAAGDLYDAVAKNPMTAMADYGGRRIEVVGTVKQVGITQKDQLETSGINIAWTSWLASHHGSVKQSNMPVVFIILEAAGGEVGCFIDGEFSREDYHRYGEIEAGQRVLLEGESLEIDSTNTPPVVALGGCWLAGVY